MEKTKDFFYNKNDFIVAFIVLAIAILIIYFRVADILSYPAEHVANQVDTQSVTEEQLQETTK